MASLYRIAAQLGYREATENRPTRGSPRELLESLDASIVQHDKPVGGFQKVWYERLSRRQFSELNLSQAYLQVGEGHRFLGLEFFCERRSADTSLWDAIAVNRSLYISGRIEEALFHYIN